MGTLNVGIRIAIGLAAVLPLSGCAEILNFLTGIFDDDCVELFGAQPQQDHCSAEFQITVSYTGAHVLDGNKPLLIGVGDPFKLGSSTTDWAWVTVSADGTYYISEDDIPSPGFSAWVAVVHDRNYDMFVDGGPDEQDTFGLYHTDYSGNVNHDFTGGSDIYPGDALDITFAPAGPDPTEEVDDDSADAVALAIPGQTSASLDVPADQDWYVLSVNASSTVTVWTTSTGSQDNADTKLIVHDLNASPIGVENDDGGPQGGQGYSEVVFTNAGPVTTTFYVQVYTAAAQPGPYTIHASY